MSNFNIPFLWETILKLFVAAMFISAGLLLIVNNESITKELLKNSRIFQTPDPYTGKKDISPGKLKFNRIMIYFVGSVFTLVGLLMLFNLIKVLMR